MELFSVYTMKFMLALGGGIIKIELLSHIWAPPHDKTSKNEEGVK